MDKSERLLNLLIMLLVQRRAVAKARIREIIYPDSSTEAFEKMFERDKEELRSLGVPVEVEALDAYFDDEPGYRIRPDRFALPDVDLTSDEAAVVGLATKVWQHARLAEATTTAVRKLTAAGIDVDLAALDLVEPRLSADEPSFDVFWEATLDRVPVRFDYVRTGEVRARTRHLQPWGVARYAGRWYVVGFDTDRRAERIFRLSRVQGRARRDGRAGSYEIPPGTDVGEVARRLAPVVRAEEVVLLVRRGAGTLLRRDADRVDHDVDGPAGAPAPTSEPAGGSAVGLPVGLPVGRRAWSRRASRRASPRAGRRAPARGTGSCSPATHGAWSTRSSATARTWWSAARPSWSPR